MSGSEKYGCLFLLYMILHLLASVWQIVLILRTLVDKTWQDSLKSVVLPDIAWQGPILSSTYLNSPH